MKRASREQKRVRGPLFWAMVLIGAGSMHCFGSSTNGGGADAQPETIFDAMALPDTTTPATDARPDTTGVEADAPSDVAAPDSAEASVDASVDVVSNADVDAAGSLMLSPLAPTAKGCSTDIVTFTASGGVPPYTWSTNGDGSASSDLTVTNATQATWQDSADNFCGSSGVVTVTVKDSLGATATATITVTAG